ncbi:MAG: ABC transporter permease [Bacteroidota bacterium]
MQIVENIKEGLRSIRANLLRSVLTALIVAIGITSLVGILTAIDGIQLSVNDSLSELGVNTFDIYSKRNRGGRNRGVSQKSYPPVKLKEMVRFMDLYKYDANLSLSARVSQSAEIKRLSKKTNPNVTVFGGNEEFIALEGLNIDKGRNFSSIEVDYGTNVAIIGIKVKEALFENKEAAVGDDLVLLGNKYKIIGILEEKGGFSGDNTDNAVVIPVLNASRIANRDLRYTLSIGISNPAEMDFAIGEATGLMRSIRQDQIGSDNSFEIVKSQTLAERLSSITNGLQLGGFGIGIVTLLGASVALMNIMLVSVTERTREIGVRKALGANPAKIREQFIIEAIVVCLMGGALGIILGLSIGNVVANLMGVGAPGIRWNWMLVGVMICVGVGLLSGFYPAYKASKLDPIESLRYE